MKASKVLTEYQAGRRNFQSVNLRGQSFKGEDLKEADFSGADIRGANFNNTILRQTKFTRVKAGLPKQTNWLFLVVSLLSSGLSGLLMIMAISNAVNLFYRDSALPVTSVTYDPIAGAFIILTYIAFITVVIRRDIALAFGSLLLIFVVSIAIETAFSKIVANPLLIPTSVGIAAANIATITFSGVVASGIAIIVTNTQTRARATIIFGTSMGFIYLDWAILTSAKPSLEMENMPRFIIALAVAVAIIIHILLIGVPIALLNFYVAGCSLKGKSKYALFRGIILYLVAIGGTSFCSADLTEADFTEANLKSSNFRKANLLRTDWSNVQKLDYARVGETYLKNITLRQLLLTGEGQNQNFDRLDLRGINLQDANLQDASFIGTDLNRANLQNANLSRAKLVQTLLEGTDLTRATLTGAYIEDWGISNTTKLIQIDCDYVFLKLPTKEAPDPQRRPADQERNFEPNEFAKLAQKIPNTVDLVFKDGIDWQTFLQTFQELRVESDTGELPVIQTIENKGDGAFVIRVKVPEEIDEAEYERKFWLKYQPMLEAKDEQIAFYRQEIEEIRKSNTKLIGVVETMAEKETTKYDLRGAKFGGGFGGEKQEGGTFYDYSSNPSNKNLAEAAAEIQQLLEQLSQTNPTSTDREKMTVVAEAVDQIENNPTLKTKVINALKAGGTEAFKEAIDHPLVNILVASIEGWQDAE